MRVLFFIGGLGTGGAERQFAQLAYKLAQRGHDIYMVTIYPGGQYWEWLQNQNLVKLFHLFDQKPTNKFEIGWQLSRAASYLVNIARQERISIVYSALYISNLIAWIAAKKVKNFKLVWGIRASKMKMNWKRNIPFHLCGLVSSSVPMLIANSHAGLSYHESKGYRAKIRIVIPNGIDTNIFNYNTDSRIRVRKEWGVSDSEKLIGLVGRFDPIKGHPVFLEAAAKAVNVRKDLRFVFVGSGPQKYQTELKELGVSLGLTKQLIWVGERSDMPAVYSALDLVTSSSYSEGFPNVLAEAMACCVPCVASNVGDSIYLIGETGEVVETNNPNKLSEAWLNLLALSPSQRQELGSKVRNRIESMFTINAAAISTEDALIRMLRLTRTHPENEINQLNKKNSNSSVKKI